MRSDDKFKLKDGESARVRFLEQGEDLGWAVVHRIKTPLGKYPFDFICLNQEEDGTRCPACQSPDLDTRKRSKKGFLNIIWRGGDEISAAGLKNAPIYKRQENGVVEKDLQNNPIVTAFGDSVWLWNCTKTVLDLLIEKDITYKGLMSRDFIIKRQGAGFEDTKYFIEPADVDGGPQPMDIADMELMKAKHDIDALITPESYDELAVKINGEPSSSGPQPTFFREGSNPEQDIFSGAPPMRSSAFRK